MPDVTEDRLRKLEVQNAQILAAVENLAEKMEDRITTSDGWRRKVDRILIGDGNGVKGHNVRLDRLEQDHDRQKWFIRSLLVPLGLLALKAAVDILAG